MPTKQEYRKRLVAKLQELFLLDQPDLDFGFYRIMHSKAAQITQFLERDLLDTIENAFGQEDETRLADLQVGVEQAIVTARQYGAPNPEIVPAVQEARARYETAQQNAGSEADVYDHLHRFFERYYDKGDFISRRYFTRETPGKAAPYAIPYNGEEVKLHWANADQYYIKTAEYFSNATFDLRLAAEVQAAATGTLFDQAGDDDGPVRLHFQIVAASEGVHGNVKASESETRYFLIHSEQPIAWNAAGELVIQFEYRPDPEKSGTESKWRERRAEEAVATVLAALDAEHRTAPTPNLQSQITVLQSLLLTPAPTEKEPKRPLLAKYVARYTGRNSHDYFIHKDLSGFLRRELDFYIKNEVMRLDDIENADAPAVECYLGKIRVLRRIAGQIITFLAQLEEFQKKLWLKKKFVVETNYCLTLERIGAEFYAEIAANDAQRAEWVRLYAIDEIELSTLGPGYSEPLTVEFLHANPYLLLDTAFFDADFSARLLGTLENLDEQCDGLLIHSENFQALGLLQERYREQVQCVYVDPPYNTESSAIMYKNDYRNSSWLSLIDSRYSLGRLLLRDTGIFCSAIDDVEFAVLKQLIGGLFGFDLLVGIAAVRSNPAGRSTPTGFSIAHEYAIFAARNESAGVGRLQRNEKQLARYKEEDGKGFFEWVNFRKHGGTAATRSARPKMFYPIFAVSGTVRIPSMEWDQRAGEWRLLEKPKENEEVIWPISASNEEKRWKWGSESVRSNLSEFSAKPDQSGDTGVYLKSRMKTGMLPLTWWDKKEYSATEYGTNLLKQMFGRVGDFSFPKSVFLVIDCLRASNIDDESNILDFFGGSGTTGHAVINLNREDDGERKYILVEMGDHFNTVLKPRIQKVVYSTGWREGKPQSRHTGISHCFKYLRLESYEDTLNNLAFANDPRRQRLLATNDDLRRDYMLRYLLEVESRGSPSLLNVDAFADPRAYTLKVKKSGSDEYTVKAVDLVETFNYLIGLRVEHLAAPQSFSATFTRQPDAELPDEQHTRLVLDGRLTQIKNQQSSIENSPVWWFRQVEGWLPADPLQPNNGQRQKVLVVWRTLSGDWEQDNTVLDEWFRHNRISSRDFEFDLIYVNGSNNLPNLRRAGENWKVRLIEEEFMRKMWAGEGS